MGHAPGHLQAFALTRPLTAPAPLLSGHESIPPPAGSAGTRPETRPSGNLTRNALVKSRLTLLAPHPDGPLRTLAGAGVRLRALTADRQAAAMAQAAVTPDLDQALDVHLHFLTQVALDLEIAVDVLPQAIRLILGQIPDPRIGVDADGLQDLPGPGPADAVDVRQRRLDPLFPREVDTRNSSHRYLTSLTLPLLVLRVDANDTHPPLAADDLSLIAHALDRRTHLHRCASSPSGTCSRGPRRYAR